MRTESKPASPSGKNELPASSVALYALAEFATHGVAFCEADGYCRYANPALRHITGYAARELRTRPLGELLKIPAHTFLSDTGEKQFPIFRKDGTSLTVKGSYQCLNNEDGKLWLLQVKPAFTDQVEKQREQAMLTMQMAAEAAGIGTWQMDVDSDMCTVSPITASILGLSSDCTILPAQEWRSRIVPEDLHLLERAQQEASKSGGAFKAEYRLRLPDGEVKWVSIRGMLQRNAEGKPVRAVGVTLDITDVKRLEEQDRRRVEEASAAAEANAKFRAFFYQGSNFAGLLALDGTLLEVNRASLARCGFTEQQVVGRQFWQCGWWSRSPRIQEKIKQACAQAAAGKVFRNEMTYYNADGSEHVTDMTLTPVTDESGKLLYLATFGLDITDKKRAEAAMRASEQRYRLLADMSPDAILVDRKGSIIYANASAARLFGASKADELLGLPCMELVSSEFREVAQAGRDLAVNTDERPAVMELRIRRLDGGEVEAQAACGKVKWKGQVAAQILLRDVSEIKKAREKLRLANERLKLAIEGSGQGIWDWDIAGNTFAFSGGLGKVVIGQSTASGHATDWHNLIHPDDIDRVLSTFREAKEDRVPVYECEYRLRDNEGNWRWIWARGFIVDRDSEGKPLTMMGTLTDITVRRESTDLAWRHANLDALTGLPNRRLFRERLEIEMARLNRNGHSLALLFIDLDGFKQVNDLYGHDAGDLLLMEVAHRVRACVRQTDTVARLGGDEFTVMLTELDDLPHVEIVCQKMLSSLSDAFHVGKDTAYISASIGVALYPLDAKRADELLRKADQAMYAAKYSGKNQFHYFTKEMDDSAHLRLQITNELRRALQGNQLIVHYQPVLDLRSGEVVKAEALLRWTHPVLGDIGPAQFVPLAEEAGLIQKLGNWVFREAALCCKRCSDRAGQPFQIGVNKSPMQFMARESDSDWLQFLDEIGLSGSAISVEITEGVLLRSTATVIDKLISYRNAGVELALDDFGTGYSSMAYLHKFNIDYVKIDQSFVHDLGTDAGCRAIAEAIITMAHKLGKKVIAEGIETDEQRAILLGAGCDYGQGFLFSGAVPPEQLLAMVGRGAYFRPEKGSESGMPPA